MTIAFHWGKTNPDGTNSEFNSYIHISKSQIKISINPLINEPHLSFINIPNNALGKNIWLWIWTQGTTFSLITSSSNVVTVNLGTSGLGNDFRFGSLNVDDNPFPKIRGLTKSRVYNDNSETYKKVKEFERAEGTII